MALRGDGDEDDSNFIQMLKTRAEEDPTLTEWLDKKTDKYTCAQMQNEMLQVMALQILRDIVENFKSSQFFSIMANETTDESNREHVTTVFRYVDKFPYCT